MSAIKFFRAPVASYNQAEAFLVSIFGPDPFLGSSSDRAVVEGLVYWPLHSDPEDAFIAYRREALGCAYLLGQIDDPAYAPPASIEEITREQYMAAQPVPEE